MGTHINFHAKKFTNICLKEKKELCSTRTKPIFSPDQNFRDSTCYALQISQLHMNNHIYSTLFEI